MGTNDCFHGCLRMMGPLWEVFLYCKLWGQLVLIEIKGYLWIELVSSPSVGGSRNLGVIRLRPSAVLVSICLSMGPLIIGVGGGHLLVVSTWAMSTGCMVLLARYTSRFWIISQLSAAELTLFP